MSSSPPGTRDGALPFADARGCKEWLGALPLTNIPQAQSLVLEALRVLWRNREYVQTVAGYTAVTVVAAIVAYLVVGAIAASIAGAGWNPWKCGPSR